MPRNNSNLEIAERADRIREVVAALNCEKAEIEASGWVVPADCHIARYQAKGQKYHYWYYQLKASKSVFAEK